MSKLMRQCCESFGVPFDESGAQFEFDGELLDPAASAV
jgi:hypothetical protein